MSDINLSAQLRSDMGKGASRRLRRTEQIPAIVYGGDDKPQNITLAHNKIKKAMESEDFYSQIINLDIAGKKNQVVLKDLQRHPYKPIILHIDFLRIKANEKISMHIPLHFIGEETAPGVKDGGIASHAISEVEVRCLPADLPKFIDVDMSNLRLDETIHLSDLKVTSELELTALSHGDQTVATIHVARIAEEAPTVAAEETPENTASEESSTEPKSKK